MSWLKKFFDKTPEQADEPSHSTGYFDMEGKPMPLNIERQNVKEAREVIRAAALRTASVFGIPPHWMSYEVVTISDDDKAYFQLQISLRVWDEQLWAQSGAFEQQVLKRIREGDVGVARAVRAVLWRILPDAGCPHDELSNHEAWRAETVKIRASAYDKLRASLLLQTAAMQPLPTHATAHVPATVAPAIVPPAQSARKSEEAAPSSSFGETIPMSNSSFGASDFPASGFPNTRPVSLSDELAPTQPAKL